MKYWLFKSEPESYSIDDLKRDKKTFWDGIRNYQARNFIRDNIKKGDLVLFYHSNADPNAVVGVCEIIKEAYPDNTAFDPESKYYDPKSKNEEPTWFMVDVKFKFKFKKPVTLQEIKNNSKLKNIRLVHRGNRLSLFPIDKNEYEIIIAMSEK
ncbi:MAG: EVE domain-containing protein [Melioribacteraceae bacterium]|nr:EVE domain-containing protein [Melioribacteraceae bacterium]